MRYPTDMRSAKETCKRICRKYGVTIDFDDKCGNHIDWHRCVCGGKEIDCAKFSPWNWDILVFAVLHEIGHITADAKKIRKLNRFSGELDAWDTAIELFVRTFHRNISIKQARFMSDSIRSYLPDYNSWKHTADGTMESENAFWCPIDERIIRTDCDAYDWKKDNDNGKEKSK